LAVQRQAVGVADYLDECKRAATILLAAGVPERVVIEILGHSTLAMVKRYQHVVPGVTIAAAERIDVMGR
jgi:integrase